MTYDEIQSRLAKLVSEMMAKSLPNPDAQMTVRANVGPMVYLTCSEKVFGKESYKFLYAENPEDAIDAAFALIAGMMSGEEKVLRVYLGKLADAVDYGHENGIAAEYVDPVRITQKAMTENLLPSPEAAQ